MMKMTRKRVNITVALAAVLTAGIFGGTYAKYALQAGTTTDSARVAKFYIEASELDLFGKTYTNATGIGTDIATDTDQLIAPNFIATGSLTYDITTEVKAKLAFDNRTIVVTTLPDNIQKDLKVVIGDATTGTVFDGSLYTLNTVGLASTSIKDIPAHTIGETVNLPVTVSWDLENGKDADETVLARSQYLDDGDYTLTISAGAVLTQVD